MNKQKTTKSERDERYGPSPLKNTLPTMRRMEKIRQWNRAWHKRHLEEALKR